MGQVTGAVLAGGASRRMGRDKRWVHVDGRPLLVRAVDALRGLCDEVLVVGSLGDHHDDRLTDVTVVTDLRPGHGPLGGIETALHHASNDVVLLVAVDHPWLSSEVLRRLLDTLTGDPGAVVALLDTTQPLVSAWRTSALSTVSDLLDDGERRATRLPEYLAVAVADWRDLDPDGRTTRDVDTPEDLDLRAPMRRRPVEVVRHDGSTSDVRTDEVVVEEPLEIRVAGPDQPPVTVVTTLRTPGHEAELAAGWIVTEGLATPEQILRVETGDPVALARADDQVTVHLVGRVDLDDGARRMSVATASCGVCGRASIDELGLRADPIDDDTPVSWSVLASLPDALRDAQPEFAVTGGLHATGLFTTDGTLVTLREDVGRHNALDAAIGVHVLDRSLPLEGHVAVLSGRVGFELVAKAVVAGIGVIAAVGAPTDLAVRTAERFGVTLVGFVRDGAGNVYSGPARLTDRSTSSTGVDSSRS
ncbi:MAG: formate dehydrogenase accessory sulfurtransferase FdhD [Nitriliruptoraceae bacterium]